MYSGGSHPELRLESRAAIHAWVLQRHQQAQTRTMVLITHQGVNDPAPRPVLSGVYHDRWQKTQRGW
jgi:hypothetical protein